jgi:hypothetical protein
LVDWAGWLGAGGAAAALRPGATWIDMTGNPGAAGQAVATAEALLLGRASELDLGALREVLADSAAGSDFIRRDLDALFAGDFCRCRTRG